MKLSIFNHQFDPESGVIILLSIVTVLGIAVGPLGGAGSTKHPIFMQFTGCDYVNDMPYAICVEQNVLT